MKKIICKQFVLLSFILITSPAFAVDSYRYAHVTIDTPWNIFIFLLLIIMFPFILMAYLYWYYANKKPEDKKNTSDDQAEKLNTLNE